MKQETPPITPEQMKAITAKELANQKKHIKAHNKQIADLVAKYGDKVLTPEEEKDITALAVAANKKTIKAWRKEKAEYEAHFINVTPAELAKLKEIK